MTINLYDKVYKVDTIGIDKTGFVTGYYNGGFVEAGHIIRIDNIFPDMNDPNVFHGLDVVVSVCRMYGNMFVASFRIDLEDLNSIVFIKNTYNENPDDAVECHKAVLAFARMYRMHLGEEINASIVKVYNDMIQLKQFESYRL